MTILDILLIAVALAMDCFTVSMVSGVMTRKMFWGRNLRMALLFGFFQAAMPFIGWIAIHYFQSSVEAYDHWIAFGLLLLIGGKMILDAFKEEDEATFNPLNLGTQLTLAIATSIDALAVGISFACSGYGSIQRLVLPLAVIGLVSFIFSIAGLLLGVRFGGAVARRFKPEIIGGVILIAIGVKILLEHLLG
ncbi:MAG: manganese efflux pump MntP family protein [Bacteroidales bacterium]|nr:manganese efflux pump MntP family protein [Bacteroidales bacterium]